MTLYKIQSEQYIIALTILRNKIMGAAHDAVTNHGTVLNFRAILSRFIHSNVPDSPVCSRFIERSIK